MLNALIRQTATRRLMGVAYGSRHERRPQQLTIVRHVLPEENFRSWITDLKHALAGRVCVPAVVDGMTVSIANLSVVGKINKLQRRYGGIVPEVDIEALNEVLAAEKPRIAARVNRTAPLHAEGGNLCLGFSVDSEVLRRAASAAIEGYCRENIGLEHRAFGPLNELGQLVLGPVRPALDGVTRVDEAAYRSFGFLTAAAFENFCRDPNSYLEDTGSPAAAFPESIAFGPMSVAVTSLEVPAPEVGFARPARPSYTTLAWEGGR